MWIGTTQGLYIFDKESKQLTSYVDDSRIGGINTIYQTPDGRYTYLGTYSEGLFVIDNRTNQIENYNTQNSGLTSNNIYSIVPNRYGDIFMGTASCLSQLYVKRKKSSTGPRNRGSHPTVSLKAQPSAPDPENSSWAVTKELLSCRTV